MRMKMVKRFWCDHCNKAGLSAHAMANHEKRCTMNPARKCRVCTLWADGSDDPETPLAELIALLPAPVEPDWKRYDGNAQPEFYAYMEAANAAIPALRKAARGCPACMLAAIRQRGISPPMLDGFDFKKEMADVFAEVNVERRENMPYDCAY